MGEPESPVGDHDRRYFAAGHFAAVGGFTFYSHRSEQASMALGEAMQTYQAPIANPGQRSACRREDVYSNAADARGCGEPAVPVDVANNTA